MPFLKHFTMNIIITPAQAQALCHSLVRGSHLLPSQLPGEHTGHKAASKCSEPFWKGKDIIPLLAVTAGTHFTYLQRDGGLR